MRTRIALSAAVALALVAAGCGGNSTERLAEKVAEKAMEEASGGSADVDINDGTMKITTDTGNVSVSGNDKGITVESDEGTYQMGEGTKLPDGFPADVPLPSGKIFTAMSSDGTFAVLFKVDDAKKAFADYLEALESAGFDVSDKTEGEMNNDFFGAFTATGKGWRAVVSATGSGDQVLGVNVEPAS